MTDVNEEGIPSSPMRVNRHSSQEQQENSTNVIPQPAKLGSIRYKRLQEVMARSLQEALKRFTLDMLKKCYPRIAKQPDGEETLEKLRLEAIEFWLEGAMRETNTVFVERGIEEKLFELENIILDAVKRSNENGTELSVGDQPVDVTSLTPQQIVDAHLNPVKNLRIAELETELNALDNENSRLEHNFIEATSQIDQLSSLIVNTHSRLSKIADNASNELQPRQKLADLVKDVLE